MDTILQGGTPLTPSTPLGQTPAANEPPVSPILPAPQKPSTSKLKIWLGLAGGLIVIAIVLVVSQTNLFKGSFVPDFKPSASEIAKSVREGLPKPEEPAPKPEVKTEEPTAPTEIAGAPLEAIKEVIEPTPIAEAPIEAIKVEEKVEEKPENKFAEALAGKTAEDILSKATGEGKIIPSDSKSTEIKQLPAGLSGLGGLDALKEETKEPSQKQIVLPSGMLDKLNEVNKLMPIADTSTDVKTLPAGAVSDSRINALQDAAKKAEQEKAETTGQSTSGTKLTPEQLAQVAATNLQDIQKSNIEKIAEGGLPSSQELIVLNTKQETITETPAQPSSGGSSLTDYQQAERDRYHADQVAQSELANRLEREEAKTKITQLESEVAVLNQKLAAAKTSGGASGTASGSDQAEILKQLQDINTQLAAQKATAAGSPATKTTKKKTTKASDGVTSAEFGEESLVAVADENAGATIQSASASQAAVSQANAGAARLAHGAYIRGQTGPGILVYPIVLAMANSAYFLMRKRRK